MKLTKQRLKALISQEITNSLGYYGGELSSQRKNALKFYLGEPLGNEVEGQSQVRSQDVLEVVESILPSMMRIFTQGESIVRFEPTGPEDVQYAEQASDYVNHIFNKDNNGYSILHTMFKDALISKNGFVKYYWKTDKEQKQHLKKKNICFLFAPLYHESLKKISELRKLLPFKTIFNNRLIFNPVLYPIRVIKTLVKPKIISLKFR